MNTSLDRRGAVTGHAVVDRILWKYLAVIVILTFVAFTIVSLRAFVWHEQYPRNTLLFNPSVQFGDLTNLTERVAHFGEPDMLTRRDFNTLYPYPVPTIFPVLASMKISASPVQLWFSFTLTSFVLTSLVFCYYLMRIPGSNRTAPVVVFATLATSYPLAILLDRGNIEIIVWLPLVLGTVAFIRRSYYGAAVLFAVAAAFKPFPLALFILFLPVRRYSSLATGIVTFVAIWVTALAAVGPTIGEAWKASHTATEEVGAYFVRVISTESNFDHSPWAIVKQITYFVKGNLNCANAALPGLLKIYLVLLSLTCVALYWFRFRHLPPLNRYVICVTSFCLIPPVSYDYHLIHLYLAWAVLIWFLVQDVASGITKISERGMIAAMVCFGIIFTPQSYLVFGNYSGCGGQVKALALIALVGIMLRYPLISTLFEDLTPATRQRQDA